MAPTLPIITAGRCNPASIFPDCPAIASALNKLLHGGNMRSASDAARGIAEREDVVAAPVRGIESSFSNSKS
jgi:hypothetical protein